MWCHMWTQGVLWMEEAGKAESNNPLGRWDPEYLLSEPGVGVGWLRLGLARGWMPSP